ncbi:MAG TPA: hypothetical protein ENG51_09045, partial [Deltaproteobacteria bacterium]|nr:hypothetical protein [Deltaproteobacteria bacterium]
GQTYDEYIKSGIVRPDRLRNKIYLQPLGDFAEGKSPSLEKLRIYTSSFFMMSTEILPQIPLEQPVLTSRINPYTGKRQILTLDVLSLLIKNKPREAFCVLAITMEDLYPDPSWNFVFGQASPQDRVGVFSFARYDPDFYGGKRPANYTKILLKRSCKVLAHETGHMFSLAHCIFFKCVMNGSNHLQESDARPLFLCPVCLRKLHFAIGFDVVKRYEKLLIFFRNEGFDEEAMWIKKRLEWCK